MNNKCSKCGRPLKSKKSKQRGYGLTCFNKQFKKDSTKMLFTERKEK